MATGKDCLQVGAVVFGLCKYSFDTDPPAVVELRIEYEKHRRFYAYDKGAGVFSFVRSELGKTVFLTREEAEAKLAKLVEEMAQRRDNHGET